MKGTIALSMILAGAMLSGGCATKKYVQQTATPIQTKVDQVADSLISKAPILKPPRKTWNGMKPALMRPKNVPCRRKRRLVMP